MKRLALLASLFLSACSAAVPKVAVEPRETMVAPAETTYLVWSRTDDKGVSKYETVLLSSNGDVIARRDGMFLANGESLYEVRITQEKIPSLACNMDLWSTPRAELPEEAFSDQIFEKAEIIDVASGQHRAPIGEEISIETNDQGIAIDVSESHMTIVGSLGSTFSLVETSSQWPCGTMHMNAEKVHAFDAATGKPADFGTCTETTRSAAEAQMSDGFAEDFTLGEIECGGVTMELDEHHRFVANHHYQAFVTPPYGMNGWLATSEQKVLVPADYETDIPVVVGVYYDTHEDARGYSVVDSTAVRTLFVR